MVTFTYKEQSVMYSMVERNYGYENVKCWLDRNPGATQVATSRTDATSYGDLFQLGLGDDGHQNRTSGTTSSLSSEPNPGNESFITASSGYNDWRSPQNNNLLQGVSGFNNPCPSGWRIPAESELSAESTSWSVNNASGAFGSALMLPMAGYRGSNGSLMGAGAGGSYWSSTISSPFSRLFGFDSSSDGMFATRALGLSVRCLKDQTQHRTS